LCREQARLFLWVYPLHNTVDAGINPTTNAFYHFTALVYAGINPTTLSINKKQRAPQNTLFFK